MKKNETKLLASRAVNKIGNVMYDYGNSTWTSVSIYTFAIIGGRYSFGVRRGHSFIVRWRCIDVDTTCQR